MYLWVSNKHTRKTMRWRLSLTTTWDSFTPLSCLQEQNSPSVTSLTFLSEKTALWNRTANLNSFQGSNPCNNYSNQVQASKDTLVLTLKDKWVCAHHCRKVSQELRKYNKQTWQKIIIYSTDVRQTGACKCHLRHQELAAHELKLTFHTLRENNELESDHGWNFTYTSTVFQKLSYCNLKAEHFSQIWKSLNKSYWILRKVSLYLPASSRAESWLDGINGVGPEY